jgi:hypothetical protein
MSVPFRWDITRREQLGRLVADNLAPLPHTAQHFFSDLEHCCTRIIALCGDADLVFVGRSPESIFDLLSGLLSATSWAARCSLLNISIHESTDQITRHYPGAVGAAREQFTWLHLAPEHIATRARPVALVDIVSTGGTFGALADFYLSWARECGVDVNAVKRRLRFVGLTCRTKTSPKTWRWQQHAPWTRQFRPNQIKNVSVNPNLYIYLGGQQLKTMRSNPPWRWGDAAFQQPPRDPQHLVALQHAVYLYERGCDRTQQLQFAARLARQPELRHGWLRALVSELRSGSNKKVT